MIQIAILGFYMIFIFPQEKCALENVEKKEKSVGNSAILFQDCLLLSLSLSSIIPT